MGISTGNLSIALCENVQLDMFDEKKKRRHKLVA